MSEPEWTVWSGGENPVPEMWVQYRVETHGLQKLQALSDTLEWEHKGQNDDIIAYRVVQPAPTASDADEAVGLNWSEHEDEISDAICDSMDMDWTSRDAAKSVIRYLQSLSLNTPTAESKLREALERIVKATMESTNSSGALEFQAWVRAVANSALREAEGGGE